jgi:hypothetical protein
MSDSIDPSPALLTVFVSICFSANVPARSIFQILQDEHGSGSNVGRVQCHSQRQRQVHIAPAKRYMAAHKSVFACFCEHWSFCCEAFVIWLCHCFFNDYNVSVFKP